MRYIRTINAANLRVCSQLSTSFRGTLHLGVEVRARLAIMTLVFLLPNRALGLLNMFSSGQLSRTKEHAAHAWSIQEGSQKRSFKYNATAENRSKKE